MTRACDAGLILNPEARTASLRKLNGAALEGTASLRDVTLCGAPADPRLSRPYIQGRLRPQDSAEQFLHLASVISSH